MSALRSYQYPVPVATVLYRRLLKEDDCCSYRKRLPARIGMLVEVGEEALTTNVSVPCEGPEYCIELELHNASPSQHVCFKLKTNAPGRWSVRPNGGVIAPQATAALSIKVIKRAPNLMGVDQDRHLIVSVPISAEDAVVLQEQRELHPRASPQRPLADEPGTSHTHIVPRFSSLPALQSGLTTTPPLPVNSCSAAIGSGSPLPSTAMLTPIASPAPSPHMFASPGIDTNARHASVAEQVAEIDRKNESSGRDPADADSDEVCHVVPL